MWHVDVTHHAVNLGACAVCTEDDIVKYLYLAPVEKGVGKEISSLPAWHLKGPSHEMNTFFEGQSVLYVHCHCHWFLKY
jgi:hypothetical protein